MDKMSKLKEWCNEYTRSIYADELEFINWKIANNKELSARDCEILREALYCRRVLVDMCEKMEKIHETKETL